MLSLNLQSIQEADFDPSRLEWAKELILEGNTIVILGKVKPNHTNEPVQSTVLTGVRHATQIHKKLSWPLKNFKGIPCFEVAGNDLTAIEGKLRQAFPTE